MYKFQIDFDSKEIEIMLINICLIYATPGHKESKRARYKGRQHPGWYMFYEHLELLPCNLGQTQILPAILCYSVQHKYTIHKI